MMGVVTHIRLAAIRSASITAHFGRLHGLTQGDGVGLVLFIYFLAIIVLRLAVLNDDKREGGGTHHNHTKHVALHRPHEF